MHGLCHLRGDMLPQGRRALAGLLGGPHLVHSHPAAACRLSRASPAATFAAGTAAAALSVWHLFPASVSRHGAPRRQHRRSGVDACRQLLLRLRRSCRVHRLRGLWCVLRLCWNPQVATMNLSHPADSLAPLRDFSDRHCLLSQIGKADPGHSSRAHVVPPHAVTPCTAFAAATAAVTTAPAAASLAVRHCLLRAATGRRDTQQ